MMILKAPACVAYTGFPCTIGRTLGMIRDRADDHYMLKLGMRWRINRKV